MKLSIKQWSPLPGFGLTLGYGIFYMSLIVLLPLAALAVKVSPLSWAQYWEIVSDPRAVQSYKLTIGASFVAALINAVFGFLVAWTLVRYSFPGRKFLDSVVDLPFAMPTAVSGIALATLYAPNGWIGSLLAPMGIKVAYTSLGVTVALTFIGLPFVVRSVQPAIQELEAELEEAAKSLGADRWQIFRRVIFPLLFPSLITGFTLAFARALGEYGSVVFISGNMPMKTEITSLLIIFKLEEYNYAGAAAIASVMLIASFLILLFINTFQWWLRRRAGGV